MSVLRFIKQQLVSPTHFTSFFIWCQSSYHVQFCSSNSLKLCSEFISLEYSPNYQPFLPKFFEVFFNLEFCNTRHFKRSIYSSFNNTYPPLFTVEMVSFSCRGFNKCLNITLKKYPAHLKSCSIDKSSFYLKTKITSR